MSEEKDQILKSAIALSYNENDNSPKVVAKGYGNIAEQIIAYAERNNVAVYPSPEIMIPLMHLDLDQHIPPELYAAIAEILAWVFYLDQQPVADRE